MDKNKKIRKRSPSQVFHLKPNSLITLNFIQTKSVLVTNYIETKVFLPLTGRGNKRKLPKILVVVI